MKRKLFGWCLSALTGSVLLVAQLCTATATEVPEPIKLIVGVRTDALPFSYKPRDSQQIQIAGPLGRKGYAGYVVGICDDILATLQRRHDEFAIKIVAVDAKSRFVLLGPTNASGKLINAEKNLIDRLGKPINKGNPPKDSANESGGVEGIDILCDPATITVGRISTLLASTPVYLSGITFATQGAGVPRNPCASIIGVVGDTTSASSGIRQILSSGNLAVYRETLDNFIENPKQPTNSTRSDGEACDPTPGIANASKEKKPAIIYANTHEELADAFCNGDVLHYVGDVEIVNRHLRNRSARCNYTDGALTYTDERYAIFARVPRADQQGKAYGILRFYEELSRQIHTPKSILLRHFEATFPGFTASRKLQAMYWSLIGTFPGAAR